MAGKKKKGQNASGRKPAGGGSAHSRDNDASQQIWAILVFALAVLSLCVILIKGENVWLWLHNALFGALGLCAFILPVLLFYISVMCASGRVGSMGHRLWQSGLLILFAGALIYLIGGVRADLGFGDFVAEVYADGQQIRGGGVPGAVLGQLLFMTLGRTGACVVICLALFVLVMFMTGTSLIQIYSFFRDRAERAQMRTRETMARRDEAVRERLDRAERDERAGFNIDVPLGPDPVPTPGDRRRGKSSADKATRLKNAVRGENEPYETVDGAAQDAADTPVIPEPTPPAEEKSEEQTAFAGAARQDGGRSRYDAARSAEKPTAEEFDVPSESGDDPDAGYRFPPISLLNAPKKAAANRNAELQATGERLISVLKSFGVDAKIIDISRGPSVTRYELQPAAGVKISKITGLLDDISLHLAAPVRIEAPIPNKAAVGIEVPNKAAASVSVREIIDSKPFKLAKSPLTVALGRDIAGNITVADIAKMPHLLIAGTTGSGKSVCMNAMILSFLYKASPDEVKLLMIDPKKGVEFGRYNGIPHLLVPVVTDPRKAAGALSWAVTEMLNRYNLFAQHNVRDHESFNRLAEKTDGLKKLPKIVIIIDELADLMMAAPKEVEDSICRLAQMARAAGMHLIIATQRPSADVITGLIKANIPSRIALKVSSGTDSRIILDSVGAENLIGYGDMLFDPVGANKPSRVQGCYESDEEIDAVTEFLKSGRESDYDEEVAQEIERNAVAEKSDRDDGDAAEGHDQMLPSAVECVIEAGQASTSLLQRRLKLGYARAARIVDEMEQMGIVGPYEGSKPRRVLITKQEWLERQAMTEIDE